MRRIVLICLLLSQTLGCGISLRTPSLRSSSSIATSTAPAKLAFTRSPGATARTGELFITQPIVQIQSSDGALIASSDPAASDLIELTAYATSDCSGTPFTSLVNGSANAINGTATFSGVYNSAVQTIYLKATDKANPGLTPACTSTSVAVTFPTLNLSTFQAASHVIGYNDLNSVSNWSVDRFHLYNWNNSFGFYQGKFYIPDDFQNRVLGYNSIPTSDFAGADFVLGQSNFTTVTAGNGTGGFSRPQSISILPTGQTAIADSQNNRILVYNSPPTGPIAANFVFGQPDFTTYSSACTASKLSNPIYVQLVGKKLLVVDSGSNRVLIWNDWAASGSGSPADMVIGQPNFTTCSNSFTNDFPVQGATYNTTWGAWTDGTQLFVSFYPGTLSGTQIAVWKHFPTPDSSGSASSADFSLGNGQQGPSQSAFAWISNIASNGTQLFASDNDNRRVLVWNTIPNSSSDLPNFVLGQSDFNSKVANVVSPNRFYLYPYGLYVDDTRLIVSDQERKMVFLSQ